MFSCKYVNIIWAMEWRFLVADCNCVFVDSDREFWTQDLSWNSSLDSCHWLQLVSQCLDTSTRVAEDVIAGKRSVVIKGKGSLYFCTFIIHPTNIVLGGKLLSVHISRNHNSSNRWTNSDEILHSCCICPEEVHERKRNPGTEKWMLSTL